MATIPSAGGGKTDPASSSPAPVTPSPLLNRSSARIVLVAGLSLTALATLFMSSGVETGAGPEFTRHYYLLHHERWERFIMAGVSAVTLLLVSLILKARKAYRIAAELTRDLRKREQFSTDIIDSLSSTIAVLDAEGIIVAVNEPWRNFAVDNSDGGLAGSDVGTRYLDAIRVGDAGEFDEGAREAMQGFREVLAGEREKFTLEYPCHSHQEERWFRMDIARLKGSRDGVIVSHTDITQRRELDEKLLHATESAKATTVTMGRLLRTISHEFRTPLGLLTGSTDIIDRYWERLTPEKRLEQTARIRSATGQLTNLVNSVMSHNHLGTVKPEISPTLLDVGDTCRAITADVEAVWGDGRRCEVAVAADCGKILLDGLLFRWVLENLLTNAFRYTPLGGTVTLRGWRDNGLLRLEIIDTGIGIPEEEQSLIFEAFYRGRNVEARRGLGVGLSIVSESLSQLGGTITVSSRSGAGTTMSVTIPVEDPTHT